MASGVQVGDKAPDFTLVSQSGERVRLYDRLDGHVVVLYFYPKDATSSRSPCSPMTAAGYARATACPRCSA